MASSITLYDSDGNPQPLDGDKIKIGFSAKYAIVDAGTISKNSRTVIANPFFDGVNDEAIAARCWVRTEIDLNGVWGITGWMYSSASATSYGANGMSMTEGIVIQTGSGSLLEKSVDQGNGFDNANSLDSAPCRVIVFYAEEY